MRMSRRVRSARASLAARKRGRVMMDAPTAHPIGLLSDACRISAKSGSITNAFAFMKKPGTDDVDRARGLATGAPVT
jgi:hypothetical protein